MGDKNKELHLKEKCSEKSAELLLSFINLVEEKWSDVEGPIWNEKYVCFKLGGRNWIEVKTRKNNLRIHVVCQFDDFNIEEIADRLGIIPLEKDTDFRTISLGNQIKERSEGSKRKIVFRLESDFKVNEEFQKVLAELRQSFEKEFGISKSVNSDIEVEKDSKNNQINYFWVTANPKIWNVEQIKDGGEVFYTAYNRQGNKRRIFADFEKTQPEDKVIFYESTPKKSIVALGEVVKGLHEREEEGYDEAVKGITIKFIRDIEPIDWERLIEVEDLEESKPIRNKAQGSLFKLTKKEYEDIMALEELAADKQEKEIPTLDFNQSLEINNLYFPKKEVILRRLEVALKKGKHIILTGPPGTGKSKLAKEICKNYCDKESYQMVTANSNWSTFDTIGGYQPNKENELEFNSGLFLNCFKKLDDSPTNRWLIIDEINRVDIDKVFGSLFSVLTGDKITLSFETKAGNNIVVRPQAEGEERVLPKEHEYIMPQSWRLIATMNTLDKASLYEMSYAFMRRFAFIPIPIPKDIGIELIENYLECWQIENRDYVEEVAKLWATINQVRKIGPAIVEDIYNYLVETNGDYVSTLIMYVLPQFEGLRNQKLKQFIDEIAELEFINNVEAVKDFASDYFMLEV